MKFVFSIICCALICGCVRDLDTPTVEPEQEIDTVRLTDTVCDLNTYRKEGYIYTKNDENFLWAGSDSSWHFNIANWELNECNLRYGLGRETFPALLEPKYVPVKDYVLDLDPVENCLVLFSSNEIKVFPYEVMISHEVVNEVHNGNPIMIAYCVLADLGAIYSRDYCGTTLTFAVSGYTYYDKYIWDGIDAFLLWDRDTESLWWPLVDRAISGPLKGHELYKYNESLWEILSWDEVKKQYPDAVALDVGQDQLPPGQFPDPGLSVLSCR